MNKSKKSIYTKEVLNSYGVFDPVLFIKTFVGAVTREKINYPQVNVDNICNYDISLENNNSLEIASNASFDESVNTNRSTLCHVSNLVNKVSQQNSYRSNNQNITNLGFTNNPCLDKTIMDYNESLENCSSCSESNVSYNLFSPQIHCNSYTKNQCFLSDEFESISEEDDDNDIMNLSDVTSSFSYFNNQSIDSSNPSLNVSLNDYNSNLHNQPVQSNSYDFKSQSPNQSQLVKLKLVLDLDNTLLHGLSFAKLNNISINLDDFVTNDGEPELYKFQLPKVTEQSYYLKLRPGLRTFLKDVSKYCDLAIHTNATHEYTDVIVSILDPNRTLFGGRIVAREDDTLKDQKKIMNRLFSNDNFDASTIIILDDRKDVWDEIYHPNIVQCAMYDYLDSKKKYLISKYAQSNIVEQVYDTNNHRSQSSDNTESSSVDSPIESVESIGDNNLFFNATVNFMNDMNVNSKLNNLEDDSLFELDNPYSKSGRYSSKYMRVDNLCVESDVLNKEYLDENLDIANKDLYEMIDPCGSFLDDKDSQDNDLSIFSYENALEQYKLKNQKEISSEKMEINKSQIRVRSTESKNRAKCFFIAPPSCGGPSTITQNMIGAYELPEVYEGLIDYDDQLQYLSNMIISLVKEYNELRNSKESDEPPNVTTLLTNRKMSVLKGVVVQTIGMYKSEANHPIFGWRDNGPLHNRRLASLGAEVVDTPNNKLTHVLAIRATPTLERIRKDRGDAVNYVHATWLYACEWTWSRVPESWFRASLLLRMYNNAPPPKGCDDHWFVLALNSNTVNEKIKHAGIKALKDNQITSFSLAPDYSLNSSQKNSINQVISCKYNTDSENISNVTNTTSKTRCHYVIAPKSHGGIIMSAHECITLVYDDNVADQLKTSLINYYETEDLHNYMSNKNFNQNSKEFQFQTHPYDYISNRPEYEFQDTMRAYPNTIQSNMNSPNLKIKSVYNEPKVFSKKIKSYNDLTNFNVQRELSHLNSSEISNYSKESSKDQIFQHPTLKAASNFLEKYSLRNQPRLLANGTHENYMFLNTDKIQSSNDLYGVETNILEQNQTSNYSSLLKANQPQRWNSLNRYKKRSKRKRNQCQQITYDNNNYNQLFSKNTMIRYPDYHRNKKIPPDANNNNNIIPSLPMNSSFNINTHSEDLYSSLMISSPNANPNRSQLTNDLQIDITSHSK